MKLYRGIVKGRQRQLKTQGTGMWFTSSLKVAKTYSDTIETWELDEDLDLEGIQIDCQQRSWNEVNTDAYARKYKDYDVIIFKDIVDVGPLVLNYAKIDDRPVKENFKDFTADTVVVNNLDCIKKVQKEILKEFDGDWMDDGAKLNAVKVEDLIEDKYLDKALEYYELFEELTLRGDYKKAEDRSEEDIEKDQKATELLKKLQTNTDPALAYGFMLYDESSIAKAYWKKRVGDRKDPHTKQPWTRPEKQADWLYEVYLVLTDQNPKYKDHLYYYKFTDATGKFNIMNNFKMHWNMYMLPELARSIFKRNVKDFKSLSDSKNDFEIAADYSVEDVDNFLLVEDFIKYFAKKGPVKANSGSSLQGLTWKKVLEELIKNKDESAVKLSKALNISSPAMLPKLKDELKKDLKKFDIDQDSFAKYISKYDSIALDILNGKDVTFSDIEG